MTKSAAVSPLSQKRRWRFAAAAAALLTAAPAAAQTVLSPVPADPATLRLQERVEQLERQLATQTSDIERLTFELSRQREDAQRLSRSLDRKSVV